MENEIKEEEKKYLSLEKRMHQQNELLMRSLRESISCKTTTDVNVRHSAISDEEAELYRQYDQKVITWTELKPKLDEMEKRVFDDCD